ncbi:MFS transporter [bacterium]|nr:MFS transporter [bacterium]
MGLAAVYGGFVGVGFVFHFLPPILPDVIADLGIGRGAAGLLMSLFALPGILLSLPGGWLVDRYGERLVGGTGLLLMGTGTVALGLAPGFGLILAARILAGCGAMVGVVALQRLVIRLFGGRGLGLPLGVSSSGIPLGIIVVLNTAGPLAADAGWRAVALRVGGAVLVIGLVFLGVIGWVTRGRSLGRARGAADRPLPLGGPAMRPIWIAGVVWFCANGAMTSFMTFAPDHYLALGFDLTARGLFTSIPMWTSAALGMVTGWLTDRHGGRALFMGAGMMVMAAALTAVPTGTVPPVLIGLALGLSLAAVVTPTVALPGALLPATHTGRGYGLLATCGNAGIFVVPPLAGAVRDGTGAYGWPFAIMGVVAAVGIVAAAVLGRGKFVPGWSRRALPVAAALLLLVGCGRQDRYTVGETAVEVATWLPGGRITEVTRIPAGLDFLACGGWAPDDVVMVGRSGRAVRIRPDGYDVLEPPTDEDLTSVLCNDDGSFEVAGRDGVVWSHADGEWTPVVELSYSLGWLGRDAAGRRLVLSTGRERLWREDAGNWTEFTSLADDLVHVQPLRDGRVFVTSFAGVWYELTETALVARDTLPVMPAFWDMHGAESAGGQLVYACGGDALLIRDGDGWEVHDDLDLWSDNLFFFGETLMTLTSRHLASWDGTDWHDEGQVVEQGYLNFSADVPGGVLVAGRYGVALAVTPDAVTEVAPDLDDLTGVVETDGRLVAHTILGILLVQDAADPGHWTRIGGTGISSGGLPSVLKDDRGAVLVLGGDGLHTWSEVDGLAVVDLGGAVPVAMAAQADGEVLVLARDGLFGWRDGGATRLADVAFATGSLLGLRRVASDLYEVVTGSNRIGRFGPDGALRQTWLPIDWDIRQLHDLGDGSGLVLGTGGARELSGDLVFDITPYRSSGASGLVVQQLYGAVRLADDRLLSWSVDSSRFMVREGGRWQLLQASPPENLGYWTPRAITATATGWLGFDHDRVLRVDPAGGAP